MSNDRLLNILRWVVTPIVLACIAGYFQAHVNIAKEQTRATYDTLAPSVLQLQEQVATLTGRIEELSRRPVPVPCPEVPKAAGKPAVRVGAAAPHAATSLSELLGGQGYGTGKTEPMMDSAPEAPAPQKVPATFDDMIQQKK